MKPFRKQESAERWLTKKTKTRPCCVLVTRRWTWAYVWLWPTLTDAYLIGPIEKGAKA